MSSSPGKIIGTPMKDLGIPVPLALTGRVPVSVSTENGPIKPGDYLTTSSKPGVVMKATKPGIAIGQAMESFDAAEPGMILAFVRTRYYDDGPDYEQRAPDWRDSMKRLEEELSQLTTVMMQRK
jgi:hypothetical protein